MLWDMLPAGKALGGAPLNFAYWAGQRGCEAAAISAIGRDSLGEEILKVTEGIGVDLSALQMNDFPTGTVGVSLSEDGVPEYTIHENAAWDNIQDSPKAYALVREADAICWGSLAQRSTKCQDAILRLIDAAPAKCLKVFDINLRQNFYSRETIEPSLRRADILKLNEEELPVVERMFGLPNPSAIMAAFHLKYLVHTCGADKSEIFGKATSAQEGKSGEQGQQKKASYRERSEERANYQGCQVKASYSERLEGKTSGDDQVGKAKNNGWQEEVARSGERRQDMSCNSGENAYILLSSIPTPKVKVASTVGAGDSFTAAFVAGLLQGLSPAAAHTEAVTLSAHVCTLPGAMG